MMKQYLMVREGDDFVAGTAFLDNPDHGPIKPQQPAQAGFYYVPYDGEFTRQGRDHCTATWDGRDVVWEVDLGKLKEARNAQINAWKLEANSSYFEFKGKKFAYREADRIEIQAINNVVLLTGAMPSNPDWPAAWKADDNTWLPLPDVAAWTEFNLAIAVRGTTHFKYAQQLKLQLSNATSPEEVEAVRW